MVAELGLDVLPAVNKKRTFVIETDKIGLGSPAQSVTDMDGWGTAAVKLFFAVRAVMYFIKIFSTRIQHGYSPGMYVSEVYGKLLWRRKCLVSSQLGQWLIHLSGV